MNNDWTNTDSNCNEIVEGHSDRKEDISQKTIDYLNTKMASHGLYNQKQVKLRVYPLGNNKYALPRKVM